VTRLLRAVAFQRRPGTAGAAAVNLVGRRQGHTGDHEYLEPSGRHSVCPWKGRASYYDAVVDGQRNRAAAWYYPSPSPAASKLKDHVAFWHGVKVRRAQQPRA